MQKKPRLFTSGTVTALFFVALFSILLLIALGATITTRGDSFVPLIFCSVFLGFSIISFKNSYLRNRRIQRVFEDGTPSPARYLSTTKHGAKQYSIEYMYVCRGAPVRTSSPAIYTMAEAEYLCRRGVFAIKYDEIYTVVTEDFFARPVMESTSRAISNTQSQLSNTQTNRQLPKQAAPRQLTSQSPSQALQLPEHETHPQLLLDYHKNQLANMINQDNQVDDDDIGNYYNVDPTTPTTPTDNPMAKAKSKEQLDQIWQGYRSELSFPDFIAARAIYEALRQSLQ